MYHDHLYVQMTCKQDLEKSKKIHSQHIKIQKSSSLRFREKDERKRFLLNLKHRK